MREIQTPLELPGVPKAKQGREVAPQWAWTEASVWTERRLATLERGIKGGKWQRLRSILRKRHKGKGRARGSDQQRWPNAYFAALGLISLALARVKTANSP